MNLIHIAAGWYNFTVATPETKARMKNRLAICDACPNKVQLSVIGEKLVGLTNSENSSYKCGLCNCPLGPLTALVMSMCKAKKW